MSAISWYVLKGIRILGARTGYKRVQEASQGEEPSSGANLVLVLAVVLGSMQSSEKPASPKAVAPCGVPAAWVLVWPSLHFIANSLSNTAK